MGARTLHFSSHLVRGLKKSYGLLGIALLSAVLFILAVLWFRYRDARGLPFWPQPYVLEPWDDSLLQSFSVRDGEFLVTQATSSFPALTNFPDKLVREAGTDLNPSELVLGVEVNGEARAYPINMLTGPEREILNDTLGGQPIAATW